MFKKISFNCFYIIFTVFSLWIFLAGFFAAKGSLPAKAVVTFGFAALLCCGGYAAVKLKEIPLKAYRISVAVIFALFYIAITLFGITTMTAPISDLEILVEAADHWLEKGDILFYSSYFTICKNTLGNAIFITLMFLPVHMLGINIFSNTAEAWGIAVNCAMIVLSVYFLYRIATRIFKNRNMHILLQLLCCAYIPFYLWAHRYYSDTLSLPFLTGGILLYSKAREADGAKKYIYSALCGVVLWAGYYMKGSIIIALVAVAIYSAYCDKKNFFKTAAVIAVAFAVALFSWNYYQHHNSWIDYSNKARDDFPVTMWLMYGAHDEGNYSQQDVDLMYSYPNYDSRSEAAKEKLKEYYSQYNFKSYIEFLNLKYGITYGNGLFDAEAYLNNQRTSNFTHYFLIEGMPLFMPFCYIANGLHLAVLLFAAASGIIVWKKQQWCLATLLHLTLLGNIIFFSFWETKARYAFGITPILILLCIYTVYTLVNKVSVKKDKITQ